MRRTFLALVIAIFGFAVPTAASASDTIDTEALPSVLNPNIVVSEAVVRLGDIFTNTGERAEIGIAYAPAPGERAVFDARWLYRVATAYKLDWQPLGPAVQIIVERESTAISRAEVIDELLYALSDHGVGSDMGIEVTNRFQQVYVPTGESTEVVVDALDYRSRTGRFTALVRIGHGAAATQLRLSGRAYRTIDVPVLNTRVLRGEIIRKEHVDWIATKADRVQQDVLLDLSDVIGKTPRRGIREGMPIRANDVTRPIIVAKNSIVTIFHQVPNMTLTAQGKAMQDGSDGDIVQIRNERSNQVVEAEVVGPGRVAVRSPAQQLSMSLN